MMVRLIAIATVATVMSTNVIASSPCGPLKMGLVVNYDSKYIQNVQLTNYFHTIIKPATAAENATSYCIKPRGPDSNGEQFKLQPHWQSKALMHTINLTSSKDSGDCIGIEDNSTYNVSLRRSETITITLSNTINKSTKSLTTNASCQS